ncbi:Hypothetical protein ERGA_CDS_02270 [Ehrlichia ruminantium str. Gardel]|uniref:hypothetical protein n=1 Tax=Ehrlichia ruminantium TaxID=779 RepID=UPI00004C7743|nr:hypothetical protein [Ehrlichia ruminantium]CAI27679.1 Hypothetical protein ERGA_CDS_02270 [Ehrlichia ruminantium str. Gardel]
MFHLINYVMIILVVLFTAIIHCIRKRYILTSNKKTIFNTHLTALSQKTTTKIFSISDDIDQDILTATNAFDNIPNLQIMFHNGGVIADAFIRAKLRDYTAQDLSNIELMKHTKYISDLLNIRCLNQCYKTYSKRIIISAILDELFKYYNNMIPDPSITYEIVNHLHNQGYEKLGHKFLEKILREQGYHPENIKITSNIIHFTIINTNKVQISINTDMLISAENTPIHNTKIKTNTTFNLSLVNLTPNFTSVLYTDTNLTLGIPNQIKNYITQKSIHKTKVDEDIKCATMVFKNNRKSNLIKKNCEYCYLKYKLPNPVSTSLSDQEIQGLNMLLHNNTNLFKS